MRLFQERFKNIFLSLKFTFLILSSCIFFQSCNLSDKQGYNEGYKAGYNEGFKAGNGLTDEEKGTQTNDPNFNTTTEETDNANTSVPQKAIVVLKYIKEKNRAPDGFVGGRQFGNYEKHLPQRDAAGNKISYREWDIHPKIEGKNRGAQRLITGSDGSAWYTADHYDTFHSNKI